MKHLDLDALADVLCGEAEPATVEHARTCPVCRAALVDLEAAQVPLMAALATLPVPEAPADLDDQLRAAFARERRAASGAGAATVVPLLPRTRRRPPAWLPLTAAAAGLVGLVGAGVALLPHGSSGSRESSAGVAAAPAVPADVRRLSSGTDYRKTGTSFASALPQLLSGASVAAAAPVAPLTTTSDRAAPQAGSTDSKALAADPLARLREDGALAGCLASLTPPEQPGVPLAVDYASYEGSPALVVVLPSTKPASVDVYVVGPACAQADADLRYFVRLPRP